MNEQHSSNPRDILAPLFERLRADGGRYLLMVGMTREERDAAEMPTFGGKPNKRWLTDEEYAALCSLDLTSAEEPAALICKYTQADDNLLYLTGCGREFWREGTKELYDFCHFCGGAIEEVSLGAPGNGN